MRISSGKGKLVPLGEAMVRSANPLELVGYSYIWLVLDYRPEYNAIAYKVRDECKAKTKAIADFIDGNGGKRLLEVLEMELP